MVHQYEEDEDDEKFMIVNEEQTVEELLTGGDSLEEHRARQNPRTEPVWEEQLGMSREPTDHVPIRRRHHRPGQSQRNADRI